MSDRDTLTSALGVGRVAEQGAVLGIVYYSYTPHAHGGIRTYCRTVSSEFSHFPYMKYTEILLHFLGNWLIPGKNPLCN